MMSAFLAVLAAGSLALGGPSPSTAGPASGADTAAFDAAKAKFKERDYLGAAAAFEALWESTRDPKHLYYAGLAWATAGEDARAILRWRHLLREPSATAEDLNQAENYLSGALGRTTTVALDAKPAALLGRAQLELSREGSLAGPFRVELADTTDNAGSGHVVHLEPGSWKVTLHPADERYTSVSATVLASANQTRVAIPLELAPATSTLELQISAQALATGVSVTLRDADGRVDDIQLKLTSEQVSTELPVGTWHLTAESPGAAPIADTLVVRSGAATPYVLEFAANSTPPPGGGGDVPESSARFRHPRLALGLGASGAAAGVTGAILIAVGEDRMPNRTRGCITDPTEGALRSCAVDGGLDKMTQGALSLGGSLGLATTAGLAHLKMKPRGWYIPLLFGVAATAGGLGWNVGTLDKRKAALGANDTISDEMLNSFRATIYPSALLAGLGGGLLVGSTLGLLASRRKLRGGSNNPRVEASLTPRGFLRLDF